MGNFLKYVSLEHQLFDDQERHARNLIAAEPKVTLFSTHFFTFTSARQLYENHHY